MLVSVWSVAVVVRLPGGMCGPSPKMTASTPITDSTSQMRSGRDGLVG